MTIDMKRKEIKSLQIKINELIKAHDERKKCNYYS